MASPLGNAYAVCGFPTSGQNLALGKPATQSSTQNNATAARAVDGNTDSIYDNNSVTHTTSSAQPWWQVDLGAVRNIKQFFIFNRTDVCCDKRLANFQILVSNDGKAWTPVVTVDGTALEKNLYQKSVAGRFVRVQLRGTDYLSLAEVQVYGE